MRLDFSKIKKVYIIGIKGSGIVAVVEILSGMGIEVLGSDTKEIFFTDKILKKLGIKYFENFSSANIPANTDLIIHSTAYNEKNNPEMEEAKKRKLPIISYPEILGYLFNQKYGLAVCGTHGKTTTSAMLAETLSFIGKNPCAVVGSKVINWGGNALFGEGEFFVAEADEYQNKLQYYSPKGIILTSADFDHPDFFKDFLSYKKVFKEFVARVPKSGFLVVWGDNVDTLEIAQSCKANVFQYGFNRDCDYRIENYELKNGENLKPSQFFEVFSKKKSLGNFEISLVGKHNVLNATSVIASCYHLGLNLKNVAEALKNFQGTSRRFEYIGERNGAILIDDYGHHPEEIQATLSGARQIYPQKNIWAIFQAHTFTRTKALLSEFSQSFFDANKVIVLDIYGSAREFQGGVHSQDLVDAINKFEQGKAFYLATVVEAAQYLKDKIGENDVVITIGAGNGWEVVEKLKE